MCKLLYIVKFCTKSQVYDNKPDRHFYNEKKAYSLVDEYRTNDYHWATLHTIQPEE